MAPLPPRDQRHLWLYYQVDGYTKEIVHDFEQRLQTIFERQVNRVHILYFEGLTPDRRQDLTERLRIVYTRDDGHEEMAEGGFEAYWLGSNRVIPNQGDLSGYWIEIYSNKDFLRSAPSYTYIRDLVRRLYHRLISYSISRRGPAPKKPAAAPAALGGAKDSLDIDEGAQAIPASIHAPLPPPPATVIDRHMSSVRIESRATRSSNSNILIMNVELKAP
nr:hypothetical protein [Tanacetum cinerariifolium]